MKQLEIADTYLLEDLRLVEREKPASPGPGEVMVKMGAVSLNFRDLLVATGNGHWRPTPGRVPGSDGAGRVVEVGEGVSRFAVGDRVITTILPNWISGPMTEEKSRGSLGGVAADGVLAEFRVLNAESLVLAPDYLTDAQAATFPTAGLTAWHALQRAGELGPDSTLLVQGTGGVSLFALQIGLASGAKVLATSGSDSKIERLKALGAHATVNYQQRPEWSQDVLALTEGKGADVTVDIGGASTLHQSVKAAAHYGVIGIVGLTGGLEATFNVAQVFFKNLRIEGIETGSREMLEAMLSWFSARQIVPVVDSIYSFENSREAFLHLQSGQHVGKVCITF